MREALTRLQLQGLVVIVPKKGTFVFQPTLADVEQLASFRLILEVAALRLCRRVARDGADPGLAQRRPARRRHI